MAYLALVFLSFFSAVYAAVFSNYPVNAQLPPVARVSQPFSFVFSQGTFGGSDSQTVYSLLNAPSWLEVDSTTRTLSGTPQKEDAGSPEFELIATDPAGSATMQVTLIVTADDGPTIGRPLAPQLQALGPTSSPSNILVRSGDSFSISFDPESFTNTHPSTIYYGTSYPENAPLPSWIGFDQANLRFYGTAPSIGPQTFSLNLVASDVSGFSAAVMTFELTISPHIFSFEQSARTLFVTAGKELTSPKFINTLMLDGNKPTSEMLTESKVDAPDWLEVDKHSLSFKGDPPANGQNRNVTITMKDIYQDTATLVVTLQYSQFFRDSFHAECDAVIGRYFSYTFNNSVLTNDSAELDIDLDKQPSWLRYNRENRTIYGGVPSDSRPDTYIVQLTAREGTAEGNKTFAIRTVTEDESDEDGTSSNGSSGSNGNKAGIIVMAVFIPLGCIGIILLLLYCRRRRQQAAGDKDETGLEEKALPPGPTGPELSHCQPFERNPRGNPPPMFSNPPPESKPPKLELEPWWNVNSDARNEGTPAAPGKQNTFSSSTIEWDFIPLRDPEQDENKPPEESVVKPTRLSFQSSPLVRRGASNRSGRREPLKPIQPRRSMKRNSAISSRSKRWSKRSSGISTVSTGLPVRLSGAGHGAGGFGPPGHGFVKLSWQNTQASLQSEESNLGNLAPLFPRPPVGKGSRQDCSKRLSVRTVDRDSLTISESDSLEAFVQGRARSRHSSNPFIAGGIGRRVSSSLHALERARSNASYADTLSSPVDNDDLRQRERPWSVAMSGSIYTDDYRHSAYLSSLSEESPNIKPHGGLTNGPSQSSLAQHYSKIISPLPRFFSELSLNNTKHEHATGAVSEDSQNLSNTRRWSRSNPSLQNWRRHRKSPSASSIAYDAKPRRVSLIRAYEQGSGYQRGLREPTESLLSSDIAFV